jgi:hypothetical protein
MNNLLSAAPERMRKFLNVWRDLGAEDKLKVYLKHFLPRKS